MSIYVLHGRLSFDNNTKYYYTKDGCHTCTILININKHWILLMFTGDVYSLHKIMSSHI